MKRKSLTILILILSLTVCFLLYKADVVFGSINTSTVFSSVSSLNNGLTFYANFDGGTTKYDTNSSTNPFTVRAGYTNIFKAGVSGQGYFQEGLGARLYTTNHVDLLQGSNDFTIATALYPTGQIAAAYRILSWNSAGSTGNFYLNYGTATFPLTSVRLMYYDDGFAGIKATDTVTIPNKKWSYIVVQKEGLILRTYIDNVLMASTTVTGGTGVIRTSSQPLYVLSNTANQNYQGGIDDIRIYNRAINATERTLLYNQVMGGKLNTTITNSLPRGTVTYIPFDNSSTTVFRDYGSAGLNVSRTGVWGALTPFGRQGIYSFGIGGNILSSANMPTDYFGINSTTIAFWIKPDLQRVSFARIIQMASNFGVFAQFGTLGVQPVLTWCYGTGIASPCMTPITMATNKWTWVVLEKNGATMNTYFDNVLAGTRTNGTGITSSTVQTLQLLGIPAGDTRDFKGSFGEFIVAPNTIWTAQERTNIYNSYTSKMAQYPTGTNNIVSNPQAIFTFNGSKLLGTTATDEVSGISGVITGAKPVIGVNGQAMKCDGINDSLTIADASWQRDNITISGWYRLKRNLAWTTAVVWGKATGILGTTGYNLVNTSPGQWTAYVSGTAATNVPMSSNYGEWFYATVAFHFGAASSTVDFYKNGQFILQRVITVAMNTTTMTTVPLAFCNQSAGGTSRPLQGEMDNIKIFNRVLTATEVAQLYKLETK